MRALQRRASPEKVRFGETPKPALETSALPGSCAPAHLHRREIPQRIAPPPDLPTTMSPRLFLLPLVLAVASVFAADPKPEVRRIPPPGIAVPEPDRAELTAGVAALGKEIESLRGALQSKPQQLALLPDVMIFHKAVDWALRYDEFFDAKEIPKAKAQLALGLQRAKELRDGQPSWTTATGLVVRGYVSNIDDSVQPYGLVIPDDWKPADAPRRLDFWLHGRGEKLSELNFLEDRMKNKGEFTPPGAFVLHLYGRYCCANKFAGEVDLFEALADAKKHYAIDDKKLVVRGFSMGGASAWQFGTHFAGMWAAVAPGAGFGESKEFLELGTSPDRPLPPEWEQTLWRWYDSTGYVANLANTTTVAYSGEIDGQKQAADIMIRYAEKEGLTIPHIIGPNTPHKYHPDSKPKIEELVSAVAEKGREAFPPHVHFTTYSLAYWKMEWLQIWGMEKEWERADIDASVSDAGEMTVKTGNVSSFWIVVPDRAKPVVRRVFVDGQKVAESDGCTFVALVKQDGKWTRLSDIPKAKQPHGGKGPDLCGPIDHAFMSRFVFVRPTGKPINDAVGAWTKSEMEHAIGFWRAVFRGEPVVKDDTALSQDDIENANLILWGDFSSNQVLKRIGIQASRLTGQAPPDAASQAGRLTSVLQWDGKTLQFGGKSYDAAHHVPILIFPNPLNPRKYLVLNSGPTFREQALLNNADQTPKLPDWAVIDLRTPPGPVSPGLVVDAGFFDEQWRLPSK